MKSVVYHIYRNESKASLFFFFFFSLYCYILPEHTWRIHTGGGMRKLAALPAFRSVLYLLAHSGGGPCGNLHLSVQ
jgi:hypothetical protein